MGRGKKILSVSKLVFLEKMAYTKALWVDIASVLASVFIYYFLWQVVYRTESAPAGYARTQMVTYVILSKILASQFSGGINRQLADWIFTGNIGTELSRPMSLFTNLFARRTGEFGFYLFFKALPVLMISYLFLGGAAPAGLWNLVLFFVSVGISIVLLFYFEMLVGMGTVYTLSYSAFGFLKQAVLELLSGGIVPLAFFPDAIERIVSVLPFAGMVSVPVNTYLGRYGLKDALFYTGLQCVWCIVMYFITKMCYGQMLKKVVIQGG